MKGRSGYSQWIPPDPKDICLECLGSGDTEPGVWNEKERVWDTYNCPVCQGTGKPLTHPTPGI